MEATTEGHRSSELSTEEVAVKTNGVGSGRDSGALSDEGVIQEARRPTFEEALHEHEGSDEESSAVEALGVDVAVADDGNATEKARPGMRSGRTMRGPRRIAARHSALQHMAVVLVDKYNTAYRIGLLLLLVSLCLITRCIYLLRVPRQYTSIRWPGRLCFALLAFICAIQCYAQFIVPVPPTASELDTLAPETLTNPQNTRYEVTAVGVVETIILGSIGLLALIRAVVVVKTLFLSDNAKLNILRSQAVEVEKCRDRSECTVRKRIVCMCTTLRSRTEMTGDWFWQTYFSLQIFDTVLQIIRLAEQGGRSLTGEQTAVADRTAIMTQATLIMLVMVVGPTTLVLNNRVWASLFDVMAAFSFTGAYLIISGNIFKVDTWHTLHFSSFTTFLSSLVPAVLSLDNIVGVDRYLLEIAKRPELTRAPRRGRFRYYVMALTLWVIGISGFSYVTMTQFKGDCEELIARFGDECLLPVYPILDSDSCDCRMASVYLHEECVQDDMPRLSLYSRMDYLMISDNNPTPPTSCTNQPQKLLDAVSKFDGLVVLSLVAVPMETLNFGLLEDLEVLVVTATQLSTVPNDVQQRLPSIRSFQFELSQIQELPFESLREMRHLEYLGLAGNPICQSADFPEWTEGIVDCGSGSAADACDVDASLIGLSQSLTGYCRKWLLSGASQLCLPACTNFYAPTYAAMDMDGSNTMNIQENTALFQMFGLIPPETAVTTAVHHCIMEACGKEPSDEITAPVEAVLFLLGESSCEACDF